MKSPFDKNLDMSISKRIESKKIIDGYRLINVDVERYFLNLTCLELLICPSTGYKQYYPVVCGDSSFYESLQKFDWYYSSHRWIYDEIMPFLRHNYKLLEIGCGQGYFLKRARNYVEECVGLELNEECVKKCTAEGLTVYPLLIQDFSKDYNDYFDIVCFFEVLEHVPDTRAFIEHSYKVLKKGGYLILSVPNNKSLFFKYGLDVPKEFFLSDDEYRAYYLSSILNLPPHHVSLWDKDSILSVFSQYGYSVVKISYEPVYPAWIQRYFQILKYSLFLKASPLHNLLSPLTIKLLSHFSKLLMNKVGIKLAFIKGHSIAVILKKDE
jgi:2-polyprenyl-3-methyl-5-hydroxy-6-metoxy-1,4-benzoquinol methylase